MDMAERQKQKQLQPPASASNNNNDNDNNNAATNTNHRLAHSRYLLTLQRAIRSVQACDHAITTVSEAMELKFVGERLAQVIVPKVPTIKGSSNRTAATTTTELPTSNHPTQIQPINAISRTASTADASTAITTTTAKTTTKARKKTAPTPLNDSVIAMTPTESAKELAYLKAKQLAEELVLPTGPWKVILLVDIREHKSQKVVAKCQQSGIPCEERALPIGDMAWIAQCGTIEVLLGTILERKHVEDLATSIFGTRFQEQRLRLVQCGVPQLLYLVEGDLSSVVNCPGETLRMAMIETRVQLGFGILHTKHLDHTVQTLKGLHRRIVQRTFPLNETLLENLPTFAGRDSGGRTGGDGTTGIGGVRKKQRRPSSLLEMVFDEAPVPPFGERRFMTYLELKTKIERDREAGTRTVGAIFCAMLKQVASLSQKKCEGIANVYPTMNRLMEAYEQVTTENSPTAAGIPVAASASAVPPAQNLPKPRMPLLVKDVSTGTQRVGPSSAAELDVVCCMTADGTLRSLKHGTVVNIPGPGSLLPSTCDAVEAVRCSGAWDDVATESRGSAVASAPVEQTAPGWPLDHLDTQGRTTQAFSVDRVPTAFAAAAAAYEPAAWSCDDSSSSDGAGETDGGPITAAASTSVSWVAAQEKPPILELLSDDDDETPRKLLATTSNVHKKRPHPSVSQMTLEILSDDDDDDSCRGGTVVGAGAGRSKKVRVQPPARTVTDLASDKNDKGTTWGVIPTLKVRSALKSSASEFENNSCRGGRDEEQLLSCGTITSKNVASSHGKPREYQSDSSVLFSSPSTVGSDFQHQSPEESGNASSQKQKPDKTNVSIVEIDDDSSGEEESWACRKQPARSSAVAAAAVAVAMTSNQGDSLSSPEDLRTRLARRMERETIEID